MRYQRFFFFKSCDDIL